MLLMFVMKVVSGGVKGGKALGLLFMQRSQAGFSNGLFIQVNHKIGVDYLRSHANRALELAWKALGIQKSDKALMAAS